MKILYVIKSLNLERNLEYSLYMHAYICTMNSIAPNKQKKTMKYGFLVFIQSFYNYNNTIPFRLGSSGEDFATVLLACLRCWLGQISWIVYGVSVPSSCSLNTFFNTTNGFLYILIEIQALPYCLNKSSW